MPNLQLPARVARLGAIYFAAASLALILTRFDGGIAFLWAASAILIADLNRRPRRQWPASLAACGLASGLATGLFGVGWVLALPFVAINLIEATLAAWILRRRGRLLRPLSSPVWLTYFVLAAGIVGPLVGGVLAAAALTSAGRAPAVDFANYFAGRALGNITMTPLALLLGHTSVLTAIRAASRRDIAEHVLLLGLLFVLTAAVFVQHDLPLLFLPVLPIILATFRIGPGGTAVAIVILAVVGAAATVAGAGPLQPIGADTGDRIQFFQFYLAVTVLTVLPVAAVLQRWKHLTSALRLSEARYRLLAEHSTDIVLHLEVDGHIRYVSPSIRHIGGHEPDRLIGQPCWMMIAPEHLDRARAGHVATVELNGATHTFDYIAVTVEGHERWCESHSRALLDEEGRVESVLCVVRDISKRKALEHSLAEAALTDPLTGLANRRAFRSVIDCDAAEPGSRSAGCLAVLDIDHFKRVNDRFGHAAGDEVLRSFARVAKSIVRERDLVARIGGEEFAIFFPATSVKQALRICDRLRSAISRTSMPFGTAQIIVTVSGGVAALGNDGIDAALKLADRALYEAKRNGRDQLALVA